MKKVCLVNGSLRGKQAASLEFLKDLSRQLPDMDYAKTILTVRARVKESYPENMLESLARADALVIIFPLHNYGLPGALMRFLEDYYQYIKDGHQYKKEARVYVIVNCAFPRPEATTGEAIRVVKNFCRRLSLNWRCAVCIGTGPVVVMTKRVPFLYPKLKKAYLEIAADIKSNRTGDEKTYLIKPIIPESVIARIKRHYEKSGKMIEKNQKPPQS
jgi:hypothetical protein